MIYATYSDFTTRYATRLPEADIASHYLPFASGRLEGLLGAYFTVPFSSNNLTARDLTIDLAYLLILQRSKDSGDADALGRMLQSRLAALAKGTEAMITSSGETLIGAASENRVWGNTAPYDPVFNLLDSVSQKVDPDRLDEEESP